MTQEAYKDRDEEILDVVNFITQDDDQILLYDSAQGLGNTAFLSRIIYIYRATPGVQIFSAELTPENRNPIHAITGKMTGRDSQLFQSLQMFTDKNYGTYEVPVLPAIIKDFSQSETLAALFQPKTAIPIYAGFYQDRLKEMFFLLVEEIAQKKKVVLLIDNIQFMDHESVFELQGLLNYSNVKLVCSKSGNGENFDKFYYETKYKYNYKELSFPIPDIAYVKKLGEIYRRTLTDHQANVILAKANRDVRKILYYLRGPMIETPTDSINQLALKTMYLYDDFMSADILRSILEFSPYKAIFTKESLSQIMASLEKEGYLNALIKIDNSGRSYCVDSSYKPNLDIADRLVLTKAILRYYNQEENLSYQHTLQAWRFASSLNEQDSCQKYAVSIVKTALKMGYMVDVKIVTDAQKVADEQVQLLIAIYYFCNAEYSKAKTILDRFIACNENRAIDVIYAITLNRCRCHTAAYKRLSKLINTSEDVDELAILVSFLISNDVHSNHLEHAAGLYEAYNEKLKTSRKYPYFLRNAATVFAPSKAFQLRSTAKSIFKEQNDLFGYYGTVINLTSYNLEHCSTSYALSQAQMAFEGLQKFSANQIHLAANNLGVCYLMDGNEIEAAKYFSLSIGSAKTIMPKGYATFNLAAMYIKKGEPEIAQMLITDLKSPILSSGLPRLKGMYYLSMAFVEYVLGNYEQSLQDSHRAIQVSDFAPETMPFKVVSLLDDRIVNNFPYESPVWSELYAPCFLEYWTINSIDILADQLLPL